ncbi:MAG: metallophosphoesterase [Oscillospiraceae bacterium]|nr:metallophosphoesterase [Oscillospiraceae bacterium]
MRAVVQNIVLPPNRRAFAISDIHGDLDCLKGLLDRIGFSQGDILLLLGDLVEKGPKNLETLQFIMDLCRTHTVYPLAGNCDRLLTEHTPSRWLFQFRDHWNGQMLINEFARLLHFVLRSPEDIDALRREIQRQFPREWAFLNGLPTILVSQRYLFVHGGVPGEDSLNRLEELEEHDCTKNDDFLGQGYSFQSKWCVVGHWPATLYREKLPSCNPLIEARRQIISIDGGRSVKKDGQLNALLLPPDPDGRFSWVSFDGFPQALALDPQPASEAWVNVRYGDNAVEVLHWDKEFSTCRHLSSGAVLELPTRDIWRSHRGTFCEDFNDYALSVQPGDRLTVVAETSRGFLVKKDGAGGWYAGRLSPLARP